MEQNLPNISNYEFSYTQLSQIDWRATVLTPEKLRLSIDIRCGPQQPPNEAIYQIIQNKEQRKNFIIELDEIIEESKQESSVKPEQPKEEIKNEPAPQ